MNIMLLSVFLCSIFCHQLYGSPELDMSEDTSKVSFVEHNKNHRNSLLVVPELHEDSVHSLTTTKELSSSIKVNGAKAVAKVTAPDDFDLSFLDTPEEMVIRRGLENLPEKNRPKDVDVAMRLADSGEKVFTALQQGRFYDAIERNVSVVGTQSPAELRAQQVVSVAFNSNDAAFWELIKNDSVVAKSIAAHKIPFTLQSLQSPEYNMYFRVTYIRKNIQDPALLETYQRAYKKSVVQLQWHLFAKSILQDRAFTSGMITFHDPQSRVFSFLDGYAELISPKYKLYNGTSAHSLWANEAYTRESSHWTDQKAFGGKNFGIDIKGADGKPFSVLPGNKSHLLFGMRTNGMTFVKWEEYGTTFNLKTGDYSVLHHTLRYFEKKNLEDDPALQRREKVPAPVHKLFKKLYVTALTPPEKAQVETDGVSAMLRILEQHDPAKVAQFKQYLVSDMGYQLGTLSDRKGGEVILTLPSAKPAPKTAVKPIAKTAKSVALTYDDL